MKIFSANEAASELGVDPRALRRFLRTNASYRNVGMGGRYTFTESEVKSLGRAFSSVTKPKPAVKRKPAQPEIAILDDDAGVPVEKLTARGLTPSLRRERAAARAQRQQRLVERMRVVGVTVAPTEERTALLDS